MKLSFRYGDSSPMAIIEFLIEIKMQKVLKTEKE